MIRPTKKRAPADDRRAAATWSQRVAAARDSGDVRELIRQVSAAVDAIGLRDPGSRGVRAVLFALTAHLNDLDAKVPREVRLDLERLTSHGDRLNTFDHMRRSLYRGSKTTKQLADELGVAEQEIERSYASDQIPLRFFPESRRVLYLEELIDSITEREFVDRATKRRTSTRAWRMARALPREFPELPDVLDEAELEADIFAATRTCKSTRSFVRESLLCAGAWPDQINAWYAGERKRRSRRKARRRRA